MNKGSKLPEEIEYEDALHEIKTNSVRIHLRKQGIDPYKLPKQVIDRISRQFQRMESIDNHTNAKINALNQEAFRAKTSIGEQIKAAIEIIKKKQEPIAAKIDDALKIEAEIVLEAEIKDMLTAADTALDDLASKGIVVLNNEVQRIEKIPEGWRLYIVGAKFKGTVDVTFTGDILTSAERTTQA